MFAIPPTLAVWLTAAVLFCFPILVQHILCVNPDPISSSDPNLSLLEDTSRSLLSQSSSDPIDDVLRLKRAEDAAKTILNDGSQSLNGNQKSSSLNTIEAKQADILGKPQGETDPAIISDQILMTEANGSIPNATDTLSVDVSNQTTNASTITVANGTTNSSTSTTQLPLDPILPKKGAAEEERHSSMAIFFVLSVLGKYFFIFNSFLILGSLNSNLHFDDTFYARN